DGPLERMPERRGSSVIEVDEDVVERRAPFAARLLQHVAVEHARGREGAQRRPERVEGPVHAAQDRSEVREHVREGPPLVWAVVASAVLITPARGADCVSVRPPMGPAARRARVRPTSPLGLALAGALGPATRGSTRLALALFAL